jgi:hypothetical protein
MFNFTSWQNKSSSEKIQEEKIQNWKGGCQFDFFFHFLHNSKEIRKFLHQINFNQTIDIHLKSTIQQNQTISAKTDPITEIN